MARLAPAAFVLLWATGFVGARAGMPHAEPGTFLTIRFAAAGVLLAAVAIATGAIWPTRHRLGNALLVGALVHGVYLGGVFWAIREGMPAGVAAVIVGLQPLVTAVLAGAFLGEAVDVRRLTGLAIGLLGVCLVLAPEVDVSGSSIDAATVGATVLACLAISGGTVLQKATGRSGDLRTDSAVQYVGALVPVSVLASFETRRVAWTGELAFALIWLVLVLSVAAVMLLMWLIRHGSVTKVSALFYLVPGTAALMAWLLFDETLVPLQLLGMLVTALAVWLSSA